jgi:hypothetical protein
MDMHLDKQSWVLFSLHLGAYFFLLTMSLGSSQVGLSFKISKACDIQKKDDVS